jgi:hypothetical protein
MASPVDFISGPSSLFTFGNLLNEKTGTYEKDKFVPYFDSGIHPSAFTVASEEDKKLTQGDVYLPSSSFTYKVKFLI